MPSQVFISYSRKDKKWMDRLQEILRALKVDVWADDRIESGELWMEKIEQALDSAKVAVLLVSLDFLASDFINKYELPVILKAASEKRITLLWVAVAPCPVEQTEIKFYQAANTHEKTLEELTPVRREEEISNIVRKIKAAAEKFTSQAEINPAPADDRAAIGQSKANPVCEGENGITAQSGSSPVRNDAWLWQEEGNAVPLGSLFYVERVQDEELSEAILNRAANVRVEGVRQVGKTSLLARGMEVAREEGAKVVRIDFQGLDGSALKSLGSLFFVLAARLASALNLSSPPDPSIKLSDTPMSDFENYMRKIVLGKNNDWVVLALDQVDRLFEYAYMSEFFALFRTWVNARATDPNGPWERLTLLTSYSTEPNLFLDSLYQSIFSVGNLIQLGEFTLEQVKILNSRHGSPLSDEHDIEGFHRFVGGHPFLVNRGLYVMGRRAAKSGAPASLESFKVESCLDDGPYGRHLQRLLRLIERGNIGDAVSRLLAGEGSLDAKTFHRMRYAGLISGPSVRKAQIRCELYKKYLESNPTQSSSGSK